MNVTDTIAAIATGSGRAGIGIIRVSGPAASAIGEAITGRTLPVRKAVYLPFLDADDSELDEGIAIRFAAPESYTGEDVLELQGHGGPVVLQLLLSRVLALGARAARPGEFSERAFLNGKLDLAQAEAVADLINAGTEAAARAAVRSMGGVLSAAVSELDEAVVALRVWLEAALDFSEEDIDFLGEPALRKRAHELVANYDSLMARMAQGQRLRDGLSIVIAGPVNAGKSSLLNALSGTDTAIVTDIEGTTRDVLHAELSIDGLPLHVIDTAGMRDSDDPVEREGMERAKRAIAASDHVLLLFDMSACPGHAFDEDTLLARYALPRGLPRTLVLNKRDLVDAESCEQQRGQFGELASEALAISVRSGEGMDALRAHLLSLAGHDRAIEGALIARGRQLDALSRSRRHALDALARLDSLDMPELAAEELRLAHIALQEITGEFDSEDLLGRIFGEFCIGK
ncbi:MAG: tRNA uridine-5-carboxymethylaminomethyl(34) synthesis GTPase MnmE [Gammaproteobacteria bacterium]|nr:MAG: tRNA uridine-5-carboxymethylaminomethyl(34) synthesis GTPase MnmE [Gammaproteobacteria bacterium]